MRVSIPSAVSERIAAYIKSPQGSRSRCEPTGNGRLSQAADELRIRFRDVVLCPSWVAFSVRDNGPGIAPENRERIMEPFYTTKPVGKGTGLGLSISRSIALEHGGSLELDPESAYTCFLLKLPFSGGTRREDLYGT